ncbi:MAG: hypothetical protein Ct9H300mP27_09120 [Chloroflexota bacterium]|nr:MAG: hypothetical protein Ct9H300mP27_09120 [Chloroflexota bacterium]
MAKRSFWAWGMDSDEPTVQAKQEAAQRLSTIYGVPLEIIPNPRAADLNLKPLVLNLQSLSRQYVQQILRTEPHTPMEETTKTG